MRWRIAGASLLLIAALYMMGWLWPLIAPVPQSVDVTDEAAGLSVALSAERTYTRRDGCLSVAWNVGGAMSVELSEHFGPYTTVEPSGEQDVCMDKDGVIVWRIIDGDGGTHYHTLSSVRSVGRGLPVWGAVVALLMAGAGVLVFAPQRYKGQKEPQESEPHQTNAGLRYEWVMLVVLAAVTLALFASSGFIVRGGDYEVHVYYTEQIANGAPISSPHFMNQLLTWGVQRVTPGYDIDSFFRAQFIVHLAFEVLTAWTLYGFLRYLMGPPATWRGATGYGVLTVALMGAAPVFFPTLAAQSLSHGYIPTSNLFHNPTYVIMRPIAIALIWTTLRLWREEVTHIRRVTVAAAGLIVLSLLTKPNHAIVWGPSVGLWLLVPLLRERRVRWSLWAMLFAALPVLAVQFFGFFTDADAQRFTEPSQVIVAPLAAMAVREPRVGWMAAKWLLSSLFPLGLLAAYPRQTREDDALMLTWTAYVVGLSMAYLLGEAGKIAHGNFIFSAQIALDGVMIVSAAHLFRVQRAERDGRWLFVASLLMLHVSAGVVWHAVNLLSRNGFVWW